MGRPACEGNRSGADAVSLRALKERTVREKARRNYGAFLELVHGELWVSTRFSRYLAGEVQRFLEEDTGHAYDILILETPPQHGKSMAVTESLPAWVLLRRPETRVILASYNQDSAERFSRRNREKVAKWGPLLTGVQPGGVNRQNLFELEGHRGRLLSVGILAGVTGNAADLLIIDDPIKNREEADSETQRNKLWGEWLNSLKTRLQAKSKVIVILTPWHEDDLAARILRTEEHVRVIRLPVEAEPTEAEPDPLGRAPGEPLCPELGKDAAWLDQFKRAYLHDPLGGQRAWLALYMCRPRAEEGNLIRRAWWKFYGPPDSGTADAVLPDAFGTQVISVDAAFKGGENNDFVAVTVWGKRDEDYYLLDCLNAHMDFIATLEAIRNTRRKYPEARAVLIEDKANGSAVISVLQREMFCVPVEPMGDKVSRVYGASPAIESGHVYLPRAAPWLEEYLNQWTAFPAGRHDDMVDSSTQALHHLFNASGAVPRPPTEAERRAAVEEDLWREAVTSPEGYDVYGGYF